MEVPDSLHFIRRVAVSNEFTSRILQIDAIFAMRVKIIGGFFNLIMDTNNT